MPRDAFRRLQAHRNDWLLTALTVMLVVLLFIVGPLQAAGVIAAHSFGPAFGVVILMALFVVSARKLAVASLLIAFVLIVAATALRLREPAPLDIVLEALAWAISGVTLTIVVAGAVFAPGKVTFHRIVGAVLLYLNLGVVFGALFCLVALVETNAFTGIIPLRDDLSAAGNLIYFSFVTLTSVGYGDILPVHPFARALAMLEAIVGQLFPATLLARLVTLELESRRGP